MSENSIPRSSKKSPIILAGESFDTKKSVSERARSILHRGVINDRDFSFLIDLFKNHDEWEEKQGSGIASIFVDSDKSITPGSWKRNKCFWLRRTDGSEVHISFVHCVTGIRGGKRNNVLSTYKLAARHAIWPQIVNFKRSTFGDSSCIVCPDSGKRVLYDECDVDHLFPHTFDQLLFNFTKHLNIPKT